MENTGMRFVLNIKEWDYNSPNFFEIKYEELIKDTNLLIFHELFSFLKFPGFIIPYLLQVSYRNSLFSGNNSKSSHVRSGKTNQWRQYFNQSHKDRFIDIFGDVLIKIGYENSNDW